jgi:hypothetical protein
MSLALANKVCGVFSRPELVKINFSMGGMIINYSTFAIVKEKIKYGKIDVVQDKTLPAKVAKYSYTQNKLKLGFSAVCAWDADQEALIIHECIHIANDLSSRSIKVSLDEAAAYTAQLLYFYFRNEKILKKPGVSPTFSNGIQKEAWEVAMKVLSKKTLQLSDYQELLKKIEANPTYTKIHDKTRIYDGVH